MKRVNVVFVHRHAPAPDRILATLRMPLDEIPHEGARVVLPGKTRQRITSHVKFRYTKSGLREVTVCLRPLWARIERV